MVSRRERQDGNAAWPQNARALLKALSNFAYMLKHIIGKHNINALIIKWDGLAYTHAEVVTGDSARLCEI